MTHKPDYVKISDLVTQHFNKLFNSDEGIYLCPKCKLTFDPECDYGGWHDIDTMELGAVIEQAVLAVFKEEPSYYNKLRRPRNIFE